MRSAAALVLSLALVAGSAEAARPSFKPSIPAKLRREKRPADAPEIQELAGKIRSDNHQRYEPNSLARYYGVSRQAIDQAKAHNVWLGEVAAKKARTKQRLRTARNWTIAGTVTAAILTGAVMYGRSGHTVGEATARGPGGVELTLEGQVRPYLSDGEKLVLRHPDGRTETVSLNPADGRNKVSGVTLTNGGNTIQFVIGGNGWGGRTVEAFAIDRKPDGTWGARRSLGEVHVNGNVPAINTGTNFNFVRN